MGGRSRGQKKKNKIDKPPKIINQAWQEEDPAAASTSSSSPAHPPWIELPREITANILHRLGAIQIMKTAQRVCKTWRDVCMDPAMWRKIDLRNYWDMYGMPCDFETLCRHAVDRSKGQLVDLNIEYFDICTDHFLEHFVEYIAERSGQLRQLRIACYGMFYKGLGEAAKRFPLLEELHLCSTDHFFTDFPSIETVGRSCPFLKSFTLNHPGCKHPRNCDDEAFAIAKNMPELRHVRLFGNKMTNDGLQAILAGCRHLESLDIRQCFNVNLSGEIGKRCSDQIKDLRTPYDSTEDYEWDARIIDYEWDETIIEDFDGLDLMADVDRFFGYDGYARWDHDDYSLWEDV